jgi:hypothetical protein
MLEVHTAYISKFNDRWKRKYIRVQDLKLWSQVSPRDQLLAMIQRHQSIQYVRISLSITYLYSLTEGNRKGDKRVVQKRVV